MKIKKKQPKTWRKVKLRETGKIVTGKTPPTAEKDYFDGEFPFITPTDITDFNVRYNYVTGRFLSKKWFAKAKNLLIPRNSICFVCIGSTIGKICLVKEDSFTNQQINNVVVDSKKADFNYIYYLLKYNQRNIVKEYGGGGAAKSIINKSTFENIEFFIPDDPVEQKRIAGMLSAFDDKIELNNKINQNLEQMAQAIFKEWFVKFRFPGHGKIKMVNSELGKIPEEWEVKELGDGVVTEVISNGIDKFNGEKIYLATADVNGKEISNTKTKIACVKRPSRADMQPVINSIWFAKMINTYKILFFFDKNKEDLQKYILSTGFMGIKCNNGSEFLMYLFISSKKFHNIKDTLVQGAVQEALTLGNIKRVKILIPSEEILMKFNQIIKPMFGEIYKNKLENQKLAALRDLLLPKLMTGEIRVKVGS